MSASISPSIAVFQGRAGGWPGYPTFTDPTQLYIASPLTVNWQSGALVYNFASGFPLPQQGQTRQTYFITLSDPTRSGTGQIFIDTDTARWSQAGLDAQPFAALGIVQTYVPASGFVTPAASSAGGVNQQTGNYTVQNSDNGKLIVVTGNPGANITLSFPNPGTGGGFGANWFVDVQNDMSVNAATNLLILGGATFDNALLFPGWGARVFSDGTTQFWTQRGQTVMSGTNTSTNFQAVRSINSQGSVAVQAVPYTFGPFIRTAQTANLAATDVYVTQGSVANPGASGMYIIPFTAWTTTVGTAGTGTVTLTWTDENGNAKSFTSATFSLTALDITGQVNGVIVASLGLAKHIQVSVTLAGQTGSPQYSVRVGAVVMVSS